MAHWLYVVIPYSSGVSFEYKEYICCEVSLPEFESISSELKDNVMMYQDFLLVNTCCKMSAIMFRPNGHYTLRNEIYEMAKAVEAEEVWHVEELVTEEFDSDHFDFEKWKAYARVHEVDYSLYLDEDDLVSIIHDSFDDLK